MPFKNLRRYNNPQKHKTRIVTQILNTHECICLHTYVHFYTHTHTHTVTNTMHTQTHTDTHAIT